MYLLDLDKLIITVVYCILVKGWKYYETNKKNK